MITIEYTLRNLSTLIFIDQRWERGFIDELIMTLNYELAEKFTSWSITYDEKNRTAVFTIILSTENTIAIESINYVMQNLYSVTSTDRVMRAYTAETEPIDKNFF